MAKRQKRHFEVGFKRQVVQEVESGSIGLSAAGRKYDLLPGLINQWREKFKDGALTTGPSKRERELERELAQYKQLLAEAHADREFLKKAQDVARRRSKLDTVTVVSGYNLEQLRTGAK